MKQSGERFFSRFAAHPRTKRTPRPAGRGYSLPPRRGWEWNTSFNMNGPKTDRLFIATTSFTVLFSVVGLALYGLPFYYDYMVGEFGWSRTQVTSGNALS
jgi:hypothetical protein